MPHPVPAPGMLLSAPIPGSANAWACSGVGRASTHRNAQEHIPPDMAGGIRMERSRPEPRLHRPEGAPHRWQAPVSRDGGSYRSRAKLPLVTMTSKRFSVFRPVARSGSSRPRSRYSRSRWFMRTAKPFARETGTCGFGDRAGSRRPGRQRQPSFPADLAGLRRPAAPSAGIQPGPAGSGPSRTRAAAVMPRSLAKAVRSMAKVHLKI